jgi:hypothetical protein
VNRGGVGYETAITLDVRQQAPYNLKTMVSRDTNLLQVGFQSDYSLVQGVRMDPGGRVLNRAGARVTSRGREILSVRPGTVGVTPDRNSVHEVGRERCLRKRMLCEMNTPPSSATVSKKIRAVEVLNA